MVMGIYSEYLEQSLSWTEIEKKRKGQLSRISKIRGGRAILAYCSALTKPADILIDYTDRAYIFDQIADIEENALDLILETPGGSAEIVEDIVRVIRKKFEKLAIVVPGYAKSAATIMAMAADEILMEPSSALGPIDAQIIQAGKRYSAHAFLEGLEKIKKEVEETGKLNLAYVPILQNISPGEIQTCENLRDYSRKLVGNWLSIYKFKYWDSHQSSGKPVTDEEKLDRASEIADELCDHQKWLTHGRSINIDDLAEIRLKITDYTSQNELCDAIRRYYTLLLMSFENTGIFKIIETPKSQIYRYIIPQAEKPVKKEPDLAEIEIECPNCKKKSRLQANFKEGIPIKNGATPFPKDNIFNCPNCNNRLNLGALRHQIESESKKRII
jgi:hypothetical protein